MDYRVLSRYRSELMGVAMLWVMLFHSYDLDLGSALLNRVRGAGFGGVDIFIFLSSMGLAMSLIWHRQDYTGYLARRAGRILPAYYVVMIPYTLLLILWQGVPWSDLFWNSSLLYYWVARCPGAFNWYISGAMFFYLLTPPVLAWLRRQQRRGRLLLAVGAGVVGGLALCQLLVQEWYGEYLDIFYRIPIFFLGLLVGIYVTEDRRLGWKDALLWLAWAVVGVGYYLLASYPGIGELTRLSIPLAHLFVFSTVPMCLVLCLLFQRLPLGWLRRFLRLVGENSLEIYLLNVSVFSQVGAIRQVVSFGPSNRLYYLLSYGANIALGVLLHRGVEGLRRAWRRRRGNSAGEPA